MDALRTEAFILLKPVCVQLTKEHTRSNVANLFTAVRSVNINTLQELQEYVLFPLRIILKQPKKCGQDMYLDVYTCMEYVIGHTKLTHWDMFQDIFNTATTMLACPSDHSKVARLSEELKIAIIQTVRTLVKSAEHSVLQHLYTVMSIPVLGHAVSLLINIAEDEKARNLRVLSMECLLDLSLADTKYSQCVKADIGNIFASFLPGISMTLCKIITGDTKQGYAVTTKAVYVWMRIVSLVMDDKLLDLARQKQAQQAAQNNKKVDQRLQGLLVERSPDWLKRTGSNLSILVKQVGSVRGHANWRVRLGIVECAEHLLLHCTNSMRDSVPIFLEILVGLIGDDYSSVASESRRALELFNQSQATDQQRHLVEILEENLHKLTTALPRQIRTACEEDKLCILKLLSGYLSLLGSRVKSLLLSLPHLKRLSQALIQVLELECNDIKIVEERTSVTGHGSNILTEGCSPNIVQPRKHFKHFHDDKIFQQLQTVCRLLGYFGDINLLVDHFLDIFHKTSVYKLQVTLIINEIMLGTTGDNVPVALSKEGVKWHKHSIEELENIVRLLIDEYLTPANFDLPTSSTQQREGEQSVEQRLQSLTSTQQRAKTVAKLNKNIVQISLYMEGIGKMSKVLGRDFCPLLMHVLYPLLEKLGDDSAYISSSAFLSLCDICQSCGYKSLDETIRENADYLMNSISLRLRHFQQNKQSPLVLKVMLQYSSAELLPLVDDTIQEILSSLDDHYETEAVMFMGVLQELVKAVVRWFPASTPQESGDGMADVSTNRKPGPTREQVVKYFEDYISLKKTAEGEVGEEDIENFKPSCDATESVEEETVHTEKQLPKHVAAVKEILTRSKHIVSSGNPRLRLLVLDIVAHSCQALQQHQDVLLPLIHQLWSPFAARFIDEEKLVTVRAIDTLLVMSRTTGDFIQGRVMKDVLPKLETFLQKQAEISRQSAIGYTFTVNYKLQISALNCLGMLAKNVCLSETDLDRVAAVCIIYLSGRQPASLQKACLDCCRCFIEINPDLMWFRLCQLYCPKAYKPPSDDFIKIQKFHEQSATNEYTANVTQIMTETALL